MPKPPTRVRSIRLTNDLWELLSVAAAKRGKSVNAAASVAIQEWIAIPDYVVRDGPAPVTVEAYAAKTAKLNAQIHAQKHAEQAAKYERRDTGAGWGFNPKGRK